MDLPFPAPPGQSSSTASTVALVGITDPRPFSNRCCQYPACLTLLQQMITISNPSRLFITSIFLRRASRCSVIVCVYLRRLNRLGQENVLHNRNNNFDQSLHRNKRITRDFTYQRGQDGLFKGSRWPMWGCCLSANLFFFSSSIFRGSVATVSSSDLQYILQQLAPYSCPDDRWLDYQSYILFKRKGFILHTFHTVRVLVRFFN